MSTKLIRRFLIASCLFFGATAAFSPAAFADTSATVPLGGSVASTLSIATTATSGTGLDLDGDGSASEHIVKVADFTMSTNNEQGISLSVPAGVMSSAGATDIAYQVVVVDNAATAPATGDFSAGNQTYATAAAGSVDRDLYIKYTPAALQDPGSYSGSITLSVTDNS